MPMIDGEMQAFALTLDKFLDHAAKWRPDGQVVTARDGGRIDALGRLHRLLSRHAHTTHIDVGLHLKAVADAIADALPGVRLKTHWEGDCHISEKQAQPLALIVSEIILSLVRH